MPKDPKRREETKPAGPTAPDTSKQPQPQPSAPPAAKPVKVVVQPPSAKSTEPPVPTISFNRWFAAKKFKPHWRAGMAAFTNTLIRRTVTDWDKVFETY
jgi:hypothetical protein